MRAITFTVDSALLRELGERLVGKPHIALAELVKNSYDADATVVVIRFEDNRIEVSDDGHGMDFDEFRRFWMRVGSPHKEARRYSPELHRPLTGSKGIGRLSAQFLANRLELRTTSKERPARAIVAEVNWTDAISAGELTEAKAYYERLPRRWTYADGSQRGTTLVLTELAQRWDAKAFEDLAREIWSLQPPFRDTRGVSHAFRVELESEQTEMVERFDSQMRAILDLWQAKIRGRLLPASSQKRGPQARTLRIGLEWADATRLAQDYELPNCHVDDLDFEVRVFNLVYRQPRGIKVAEARQYLNEFGGVHVYDAGFHLPYYGPETDWLGIEFDHSHRVSRSRLLPEGLQASEGFFDLPTNSRLFGVVNIDTADERDAAKAWRHDRNQFLKIQVSRDRLVDNEALRDLTHLVRFAIDLYTAKQAERDAQEALRAPAEREPLTVKAARIEDVLDQYEDQIPKPVLRSLRTQVAVVIAASESEAERLNQRAALLGALATAGISALAYEHEAAKQFDILEGIASHLDDRQASSGGLDVPGLARQLREWIEQARATRALFAPLLDEESREKVVRPRAKPLIESVVQQISVFLRGTKVSTEQLDPELRLPEGRFAEWSALFQNVLLNASNAMLDSETQKVYVHSRTAGRSRAILVEDTGAGVDLETAEELFEPFVRRLEISPERRQLGLGGTGLGLTIVRMIAGNLGARVAFTDPSKGYSTAFRLSWTPRDT